MNKETSEILQLGVVFAAVAVLLDLFLITLPVLNWLALGVAFLFVSVMILESVAKLVPRQSRRTPPTPQRTDELDTLTDVVESAYVRNQSESLEILLDKLKSIAINNVAARTRLSKKEVMDLAANNPGSLASLLNVKELPWLLATGYHRHERLNQKQLNEVLTRMEDWSR
jgi:hypothetical protein